MALRLAALLEALSQELGEAVGSELRGSPDFLIEGLASLETAGPADLSFVVSERYRERLAASRAGCVIVPPQLVDAAPKSAQALIVTTRPHLYFAYTTQWWVRSQGLAAPAGKHPSAVIDPSAQIHPSASIGPLCVVEAGARIGADTVLKARVSVARNCVIGERCVIQSGAVIGGDGFGFAPQGGRWVKIEQLGAVRLGNDVEIGANTCIDRGALNDTVLEDGVKLDNQIQIGHNVHIGAHTAMAGCVGVAGSTVIGAHCTFGGAAMVLGHLNIADHVHISAASVVARSITKAGQYSGFFPIDDNAVWGKNAAALKQLYRLRERLRQLEQEVRP